MAGLLSGPAILLAQEPPPDGPPPHGERIPGGPLGPRMEILGFEEMHPGKVVAGAPYSGTTLIETTQTLADGTTINRKIQATVFRDSQGRVRRETSLPAIGPLAASGQSKTFVLIHDPVAGTAYELRPDQKTVVQLPARAGGKKNPNALQDKFEARMQEEIANGTLKKEDLGTQTINGISAQGTRYTRTIPAGQIGNDKPITIVNERWYSTDLQIVVKSTRNDPALRLDHLYRIQHSASGACSFALHRARGLHRDARPRAAWSPGSDVRWSTSGRGAAGRVVRAAQRSSLLKTARPYRSYPHCCGEGVVVFGRPSERLLLAWALEL